MYHKNGKILYHNSIYINIIKGELRLHPATINKCQKYGDLYLDYFMISDKLITNATKTNLSLTELNNLISDK